MQLNIKELRTATPPGIFENNFYDTILAGIKLLFPMAEVKPSLKTSTITIKDRINLELSLSWNEPKVYVRSFITAESIDPDTFHEVSKLNYTFRFFALEEIFNYLYIKVQENEYIKENEG